MQIISKFISSFLLSAMLENKPHQVARQQADNYAVIIIAQTGQLSGHMSCPYTLWEGAAMPVVGTSGAQLLLLLESSKETPGRMSPGNGHQPDDLCQCRASSSKVHLNSYCLS